MSYLFGPFHYGTYSLLLFEEDISAARCTVSTFLEFKYPCFIFEIEYINTNAVVLILPVFVPHLGFDNCVSRLFIVYTFILVVGKYCL